MKSSRWNQFRENNLGRINELEELLEEAFTAGFEAGQTFERHGGQFEVIAKPSEEERANLILQSKKYVEFNSAKFAVPIHTIVYEESSSVVMFIRDRYGRVVRQGSYKFSEGQKFNLDIGKAMAITDLCGRKTPAMFSEFAKEETK